MTFFSIIDIYFNINHNKLILLILLKFSWNRKKHYLSNKIQNRLHTEKHVYMHETSLISNSKFKETTSSKDSQFVMLSRKTQKDFVNSNHVLCFLFFCCQLLQTWIRCNGWNSWPT